MGAALGEDAGQCTRSPIVSPNLIYSKSKSRQREQSDARICALGHGFMSRRNSYRNTPGIDEPCRQHYKTGTMKTKSSTWRKAPRCVSTEALQKFCKSQTTKKGPPFGEPFQTAQQSGFCLVGAIGLEPTTPIMSRRPRNTRNLLMYKDKQIISGR